jgi:hypothetical protein
VISNQLDFAYEIPIMRVTHVHPDRGSSRGGTEVTLTGAGFPQNTPIAVHMESYTGFRRIAVPCNNVRRISPTEIKCTTGSISTDGQMSIVAKAIGFQDGILVNAFTFESVTIGSIIPSRGPLTGGTPITIHGRNFRPGSTVSIGGAACNNVRISLDGTSILCITPPSPTAEQRNVVVQNADGEVSNRMAFQYTYPPITLTSAQPNQGPFFGGTQITLRGTNFRLGTTVYVGTTRCIDIHFHSNTQLTCTTTSATLPQAGAPIIIRDTNDSVLATLDGAFSYVAVSPTITSLSQTQGRSGDVLTIQGSNFNPNRVQVSLGQARCNLIGNTTDSIRCRIADTAALGRVDVTVSNGDNMTATLAGGFEFLPPPPAQVTSVSPNAGAQKGDTLILIRGAGFRSGSQVKVGNTPCLHISRSSTVLTCITPPSRNAGPVAIEVTNPGSQPTRLENAYTYRITPDPVSVLELRAQNQYGDANPGDQTEIDLILNTIRLRREQGPTYYGLYHLENVAGGLRVKRPIRAFSLQASDAVDVLKQEYIASAAVAAILYGNLIDYFDQVFPGGRMLTADNPLFFDWNSLVDFTENDPNGMPRRLGQTEAEAIAQARHGFNRLISFANNQAGNTGWILDLRYQIKRVLVELQANPTPDKIKNAVLVLSSVGQHCGPGNQEGSVLVARMFFNGQTLHVNMNEPVTFEDHILTRLDQFRDEIFGLTVAFVGDDQTAHTKNHYRQALGDVLKIPSGFANDPYRAYARRLLTEDEFEHNFFNGKLSFAGGTPEDARSHKGYTPMEIAKTLIDFLKLDTATPHYAPEIKAYFASRVTLAEAQNWMRNLDDVSLRAQGDILAADCNDLSTPERRQACVTEILDGYQGQDNMLKEMFVNATYFEQREAHFYLTEIGLRELMMRLQILELP